MQKFFQADLSLQEPLYHERQEPKFGALKRNPSTGVIKDRAAESSWNKVPAIVPIAAWISLSSAVILVRVYVNYTLLQAKYSVL